MTATYNPIVDNEPLMPLHIRNTRTRNTEMIETAEKLALLITQKRKKSLNEIKRISGLLPKS